MSEEALGGNQELEAIRLLMDCESRISDYTKGGETLSVLLATGDEFSVTMNYDEITYKRGGENKTLNRDTMKLSTYDLPSESTGDDESPFLDKSETIENEEIGKFIQLVSKSIDEIIDKNKAIVAQGVGQIISALQQPRI